MTNLSGVFIPLVVESFGRWTPLACRTLKSIIHCYSHHPEEWPITTCVSSSVLLWTFKASHRESISYFSCQIPTLPIMIASYLHLGGACPPSLGLSRICCTCYGDEIQNPVMFMIPSTGSGSGDGGRGMHNGCNFWN